LPLRAPGKIPPMASSVSACGNTQQCGRLRYDWNRVKKSEERHGRENEARMPEVWCLPSAAGRQYAQLHFLNSSKPV